MTALNCNKEITENMGGVYQDFFFSFPVTSLFTNLMLINRDTDSDSLTTLKYSLFCLLKHR